MATIQFTGLGSGLNYTDWIKTLVSNKQSAIDSLQDKSDTLTAAKTDTSTLKTTYSSLLTAITKLTDASLSSDWDVFSKTKLTSSNTDAVSVTGTGNAAIQTLSMSVTKLATSTSATSTTPVASYISGDTSYSKIKNGEGTTGSFSFFVDNAKYSVDIAKDDTLESIMTKINVATVSDDNPDGLIKASIVDGKFTIDAGDSKLTLGTSQDKSNIVAVLGLTKDSDGTSYTSSTKLYGFDSTAALTGESSGLNTPVTEGTFSIGDATFKVESGTTLKQLLSQINSSTSAGVSAAYDESTGKLTLTSTETGAFNIDMADGTSNFLSAFGLVSDGKIAEGSQTLGENAQFVINNKSYESFSNTVSSDTTGISGITFNLTKVTTENVKVTASQDSSQALSAVKSFITAYNKALADIDTLQKPSYDKDDNYQYNLFQYDTSLSTMRRSLKQSIGYAKTGEADYKTLSSIGISTGKVGTAVDTATNSLVLDEDTFLKALATDPAAVKELLLGSSSKGTTGFVGELKIQVDGALDSTNGYFSSKIKSFESQIDRYDKTIERKTRSLELYTEVITSQFQAMDKAINTLKNQYSNWTSSTSSS